MQYMHEWQKQIQDMSRDCLRYRQLAFALKEVRDTEHPLMNIALNYGFLRMKRFPVHLRKVVGMLTP